MLSQLSKRRVFVGGLPVRVERAAIVEFFSQFGHIRHCKLKKNSKTGRSVGYAYLTFQDPASAATLVAKKHLEFAGRVCECKPVLAKETLQAQLAQEKKERLLVWNLDTACSNADLALAFAQVPGVSHSYVVREADGLTSKGFGFVVFETENSLASFVALQTPMAVGGRLVNYSADLQLPPRTRKEHRDPLSSQHCSEQGQERDSVEWGQETLAPESQCAPARLSEPHQLIDKRDKCSYLSAYTKAGSVSRGHCPAHIVDACSSSHKEGHCPPARVFKLFGEPTRAPTKSHTSGLGQETREPRSSGWAAGDFFALDERPSNYRFNRVMSGSRQEQGPDRRSDRLLLSARNSRFTSH